MAGIGIVVIKPVGENGGYGWIIEFARKSEKLRIFLDGLSAVSISIIAVVGLHLFMASIKQWGGTVLLFVCLILTLLWKKASTMVVILISSIGGCLLLKMGG